MGIVLYVIGGLFVASGAIMSVYMIVRTWELPIDALMIAVMFPVSLLIAGVIVVAMGYGIDLLKTIKRSNGKIVLQNAEMVEFFRRVADSPELNK
jgi:hypothetical protein